MEPSEILAADAVFIGELTGYARIEHERFKREDGRPIYTHAVLTYRVDETLRSELPDRVNVLWYNSTFGIPEESPFPQRQIVGLSMNQNEDEATAYHLLQKPCAPPAWFAATAHNVQVIKGWLASGVATDEQLEPAIDFSRPRDRDGPRAEAGASTERGSSSDWSWVTGGLFGLVAIGSLAACVLAWRMVPRQR